MRSKPWVVVFLGGERRGALSVGQRGRCTAPVGGRRRDASNTHVLVAVFRILISPYCLTPTLQTQFEMNATVCEVPTSFFATKHKVESRSHEADGSTPWLEDEFASQVTSSAQLPPTSENLRWRTPHCSFSTSCLNPRLRHFRSDRPNDYCGLPGE